MPWRFLQMEAHFELVKANFIRCEECNENFFFDFLRHPRYFVTHFKSCHLKNLLYRFNGQSEEENARVRFGPRRKKDANHWFGQLKSTEKRMISMQDNKWSEISERDCWSCRLCNDGKADLTQVFELSELGRGQAFLHLRQAHERVYEDFLQKLPSVQNALDLELQQLPLRVRSTLGISTTSTSAGRSLAPPNSSTSGSREIERDASGTAQSTTPALPFGVSERTTDDDDDRFAIAVASSALEPPTLRSSSDPSGPMLLEPSELSVTRSLQQRMAEAERSRLRRMRASAEVRHVEAQRSKRRRENLTPVQRQADYDRRKRKKKRQDESERSRKRREQATDASRQREQLRSRERRRNASEDQRRREAERSKRRRENASEEQRLKERERCRKRYETKKSRSGSGGSQYSSANSSGNVSDDEFGGSQSSMGGSEYRHTDDDVRYENQQRASYCYDNTSQQQPLAPVPVPPPRESVRVPVAPHADADVAGLRFFDPAPPPSVAPLQPGMSVPMVTPFDASSAVRLSPPPAFLANNLSMYPPLSERAAGALSVDGAAVAVHSGVPSSGSNSFLSAASAALPPTAALQALSKSLQPLAGGAVPANSGANGARLVQTASLERSQPLQSNSAPATSSGERRSASAAGTTNSLAFV